ncbi:MAG: hypothetical protein JXA96_00525 [Sedimentisphaerales bacterium]|nr:hypothetical protein [Sedimentisphaerales bacterium]
MEPTTALVTKAVTWLLNRFSKTVIERWSRRRAETFFKQFAAQVTEIDKKYGSFDSIEHVLTELLEDEHKSEVLFESYRRVCLSASVSLGPRIIALLTARLIAENRNATEEEERIFMAAESLSDSEFIKMYTYFNKNNFNNDEIEIHREKSDSNWPSPISTGPVNLGEFVGNWCLKLHNCGLVTQDYVIETQSNEIDTEKHIDEPGTLTIYIWKLRFDSKVFELASLIGNLHQSS